MKWLDKLTQWFNDHVVEPLTKTELPTPQLEVDVPDINPAGPVKPEPIDFDRTDKYIPLDPRNDLSEEQRSEILEYIPEGMSENQTNWVMEMAYEAMKHGEEWGEIMEDMIFDFWEWFRSNYGPGQA